MTICKASYYAGGKCQLAHIDQPDDQFIASNGTRRKLCQTCREKSSKNRSVATYETPQDFESQFEPPEVQLEEYPNHNKGIEQTKPREYNQSLDWSNEEYLSLARIFQRAGNLEAAKETIKTYLLGEIK